MEKAKIDRSLAEVREWRKEAQDEFSHLSREAEAEEMSRRTADIIRQYGLTVKPRLPEVA
jgi:hypothetical protein